MTELAKALADTGAELVFPSGFDPTDQTDRFVSCSFEGAVSGFDFGSEPYDSELFELTEEDTARIGDRDLMLRFSTYSNAQEIAGTAVASVVLGRLTEGALITEFTEEILWSDDAASWLSEFLPPTREQFNGPCKFRSFSTEDVPLVRVRVDTGDGA